jgi:hypothetical protein
VRAGQPVLLGHRQTGQRDLGLPHRAQRPLTVDPLGVVTWGALLDQEPFDPAVRDVAGPHQGNVGEGVVTDPLLDAVDHPFAAVPAGRGLECDRVGAVQRLGEGERAELLKPGHGQQPALLLLLRPSMAIDCIASPA